MPYTTPPKISTYPPASIVTGSRAIGSPSGFVFLNPTTGGWDNYVGPYWKVSNRGSFIRYTGDRPYAPKNEDKSNPQTPSNIRLLSLSELGVPGPKGKDPLLYKFSTGAIAEDWRVGRAARFFAYNPTTGEFRETDFNSYEGIRSKNSQFNFTDWKVKVLYFGWIINGLKADVYYQNKMKIFCLDQGLPIPYEKGVTPVPASLTSLVDPNSSDPWPGFKEWFTQGTWQNKYTYLKDKKTGQISNCPFHVGSSALRPSSGPEETLAYDGNGPDPLESTPKAKWFVYNLGTINFQGNILVQGDTKLVTEDEFSFLELYAPVVDDVLLDPAFAPNNVLSTTPSSTLLKNDQYNEQLKKQSITSHNISEIFLPNGKSGSGTLYNPNSPLVKKRPNLFYKKNNQPYPTGPFCKTIEGNFYTGNIIALSYPQNNELLYEVFDSPGVDPTLADNETKTALVYTSDKNFSSYPSYTPASPNSTEVYTGPYYQPGLTLENPTSNLNYGYELNYTAPLYPFPQEPNPPRLRKIWYRYVYKSEGWFFLNQLSEVNTLIKENSNEKLLNIAYEGWINWFDTKTNGAGIFTLLSFDGTTNLEKLLPYQKSFQYSAESPTSALGTYQSGCWGIRTGQTPSENSVKLFKAGTTYYSF
jgi:hypothetical protein